jgi:hypothetical protein
MKVKMIKQTVWNGKVLRSGDTADIESATARRWISHGIAGPLEQAAGGGIPEAEMAVIYKREELEQMKFNELRKIAVGMGFAIKFGKRKPDLIDLIITGEEKPAKRVTKEKKSP